MIPLTLEKLKRDSRRLDHNIQRMNKKGRSDAASRLKFKKSLIDAQITNLIDDDVHTYHNDWSTYIVPKFH